ncbi:uncharacterized protein LOC122510286 [Leptopilina heterotoma]|uniref:uncharacterized protein LOC122510286 n=1 Tax=Leptopilina heterotoma TaxID=63436 RepID=UPI001CA8CEF8|nr:uncharacterized protein LOC122510286 [Leptopilina heterotoma]
MSSRKKVMDSKDQKRHSRNCSVKKGPGQYEEPDVVSSSDEEQGEQITKDKTLKIINAVRRRQPLWDNRLTKVDRNAAVLLRLWTEVDEELGLKPGVAKTTWSTTRHKFNSERRRVEGGNPSNWPYYPNLSFLLVTRSKLPLDDSMKPQSSNIIVPEPKVQQPKKRKSAVNHQVIEQSTQIIPVPVVSRGQIRNNRQPLYIPPRHSLDDTMKRELPIESSDSEVDVVEEINMRNGSILQRHMENPLPYKRVCIRQMQQTEVQNLDEDDEDDEIKRFCSYLEVMLRKMPKMNQELFCEETLDHLANMNRKLRRNNF